MHIFCHIDHWILWKENWWRHPISYWMVQIFSITSHYTIVNICVNYHLPKELILYWEFSNSLKYGYIYRALSFILCSFSRNNRCMFSLSFSLYIPCSYFLQYILQYDHFTRYQSMSVGEVDDCLSPLIVFRVLPPKWLTERP